jgi:enoyl-CoA hydratase/carnithine racemase
MTRIEALVFVVDTEQRDAALGYRTLRAYCAGVDIERLQDDKALYGAVMGSEERIVRAYRKLLKAVLA